MEEFQIDDRKDSENSGTFFRSPDAVREENTPNSQEPNPETPDEMKDTMQEGTQAQAAEETPETVPEAADSGWKTEQAGEASAEPENRGGWMPPNPGYYNGYHTGPYGYGGWQTPDGVYRNAGTGRREAPYAGTPYTSYHQPVGGWGAPYTPPPPPKAKPPKSKKTKTGSGRKAAKWIAAAAALIVVAGASGIFGAWLANERWERSTAELQAGFQEQIDGLKERQTISSIPTAPEGDTTVNHVAASGELSPKQVYAQNVNSVVSITNNGVTSSGWGQQEFVGAGSGFILTSNGYVLTNHHVVENAVTLTVTTHDGTEYEAQIVGYDSFSDVALLKVEATDLPAVTVGDSDILVVGDQVAAIGNPLGELTSSQTVGYVSAKDRAVNTDGTVINMLQIDAAINSGNSGGPLFDMYGQVVGITTAKYSGSTSSGASIEGIGFAIPINDVMALVDDLMEYGYVTGRAYLGVTVLEMDASVAEAYGLPSGPKVNSVVPDSCAERAGVKVNDIITQLGDFPVRGYTDLAQALRSFHAGDQTTITVYRGGAEVTLDITLDEKPADTSTTEEPTEPTGEMPEDGSYEDWYNYFFQNP